MNKEHIPVITDREELYDKCENMEQLFDKYYLPLLDKHYSKTYKLQQENQELKKQLEERPKEYVFIGNAQNKTRDFINEIVRANKELEHQQQKFIYWLEENWKTTQDIWYIKILNKFKEIIGNNEQD